MKTRGKLSYALLFGMVALACRTWAIDPIDHKPVADLSAALKNSGQVRIAQGLQTILAKDAQTGESFTAKSPLMLTINKQTGDWTVSVVDKAFGSTLLTGTGFQRVSTIDAPRLPTFDRQKAGEIIPKLDGQGSGYYPDKFRYYTEQLGYRRLFTGQVTATTDHVFGTAMKPVFADVIVGAKNDYFTILLVDQFGACANIAFGDTFSERAD